MGPVVRIVWGPELWFLELPIVYSKLEEPHRIYDLRLHRIQVSPTRRRLGISLFRVSKTIIMGVLK